MTRIIIENCYGRYMVERNEDDLNLSELADCLIKPVLLACGYAYESIAELFGDDVYTVCTCSGDASKGPEKSDSSDEYDEQHEEGQHTETHT